MKRLLITWLAGMLFAGFASCSQDATRGSDPQVVEELVSPSLEGITFSLRLSGQAPKLVQTRADKKVQGVDQKLTILVKQKNA